MTNLANLKRIFTLHTANDYDVSSVNQTSTIPWHNRKIIIYDYSFLKSFFFTTDMLEISDDTLIMIPRNVRQALLSEVMQNLKKAKIANKHLEETINDMVSNNPSYMSINSFVQKPVRINKAMLILYYAEKSKQCIRDDGISSDNFTDDENKNTVLLAKILEKAGNSVSIKTCNIDVSQYAVFLEFHHVDYCHYDEEDMLKTPVFKLPDGKLQITFKKSEAEDIIYSIDPRNYNLHVFSSDGTEKKSNPFSNENTISINVGDTLRINDSNYKIIYAKNIPGNIVKI